MMVIDNKFNIGQTVYLITDQDCCARIITGISVRAKDILYECSLGATVSSHYDFEVTDINFSILKQ